METQKAHWLNDSNNVRLIMPFSKVDQENRTVSGFASLNNVDKTDDVVTAEASAEAFASFRGNIREMHQPIAAGRMLSFSQEPYYDAESGNMYQGIFVTVYVSKGAENTWVKVLDGTLTGFSIGGHIIKQHQEYVAELSKTIRFITELSLFELSLVDNPANQFANVLSISKVDGELVAKGMVTEAETQNVFWCETDKTARSTQAEKSTCVHCSTDMENIGWIEVTDANSAPAELKKFVDGWTAVNKVITTEDLKDNGKKKTQQNSEFANEEKVGDNVVDTAKSEGGVNMSDVETVEKASEVDEVVEPIEEVEKVEEAVEAEEPAEETVEKAEEVVTETEVAPETAPELAIEKALEDMKTFVSEAVAQSASEQATSIAEIAKAVGELADSVAKLSPVSETVKEVAEKVEGLERATAVKKSGDEIESEPVKKEFSWGGHFASASTIVN